MAERLEEITERHLNRPRLDGTPWCTYCSQRFPCDVKVALAEVERLRGVVEAAKKRISGSHAMGCDAFQSDKPCDCGRDELRAALAEPEGKG